MTSIAPTHRASFAIGNEQPARRIVDLLTEVFCEGQAAIAAFERPDGRWDVTVHFADPPDQALVRELVDQRGTALISRRASISIRSRPRTGSAPAWRISSRYRPDASSCTASMTARRVAPNKIGIEIEAALAFGTGHHGTTRGCLLLLDHVLKAWRPRRVLDLGTGTGVLAIAAAKALHEKVLASDIDPPSVQVARENARLNVSGHLVRAIRATGFAAPQFAAAAPFDLVLANILANPLRQLAGPMARHLAPSALVILSGLLTPQAPGVIAAYRARGLVPVRHLRIEGWSSLLLRKVN